MRILLVNDDGVYAPGLNVLKKELEKREDLEVLVVAPLEERSTTGHTLTLDNTIRLSELKEGVHGCSGYPADCTLMGIGYLYREKRPDLVISGINNGANLAQDIYYSGTVAAAREATFHGIKSISISSVLDLSKPSEKIDFEAAAKWLSNFLTISNIEKIDDLTLLNINVPNKKLEDIRGVKVTTLGRRMYSERIEKRQDFRGRDYYWLVGEFNGNEEIVGSDCHACDGGYVSITPLDLLNRYQNLELKWKNFLKL